MYTRWASPQVIVLRSTAEASALLSARPGCGRIASALRFLLLLVSGQLALVEAVPVRPSWAPRVAYPSYRTPFLQPRTGVLRAGRAPPHSA